MKLPLVSKLLLSVISITIAYGQTIHATETKKITPYIILGENAKKGAYPWMVSIQSKDSKAPFNERGGHFCGGSLIAQNYVLTAAHCLGGGAAEDIEVRIGGHDLSEESTAGTKFSVKRIISHWDYNDSTINNDIALLELASDANMSQVKPISNVEAANVRAGENLTVMGWGLTSLDAEKLPAILQEVDVPLVDSATCERIMRQEDEQNFEVMLCAGDIKGGKDSCQGDSGGPLVVKQLGEYRQIGIVSWGTECGGANQFGVYAKVSSFEGWLAQNMSHLSQTGQVSLGYIPVDHTMPLTLSVQNNSDSAQTVFRQKTSNSNIATLQANNCINKTIAAGASCTFDVKIKSSQAESFRLTLESDINNQGSDATLKTTVMASPMAKVSLDNSFSSRAFYSGGASHWKNASNEGGTVRSGTLTEDSFEPSVLQTVVTGPASASFEWRYSKLGENEEGELLDFATVILDNKEVLDDEQRPLSPDGESWQKQTINIAAGEHLLTWLYISDDKFDEDRHLLVRQLTITGQQNGTSNNSPTAATTPSNNPNTRSGGGGGSNDLWMLAILFAMAFTSLKRIVK